MIIHSIAEKTAEYLAASAEFREKGYRVLSGVRVKDVLRKGEPLQGERTLELLVCREECVLLGIAFCRETAETFNTSMSGLPYVQVSGEDTTLPADLDDAEWLDFPSAQALERLKARVLGALSRIQSRQEPRSLASYRARGAGRQTTEAGYTINPMPLEQVLRSKPGKPLWLLKKMAEKNLLRDDFTPTPYGNDLGLFLEYRINPFGDGIPELMAAPSAGAEIQAALDWKPEKKNRAGRISLAQRVMDIQHRTVAGEQQVQSAVKSLLDTPLDVLFWNRPDDLHQVLDIVEDSSALVHRNSHGKSMPVYRDVLETIQALRQRFSDDPMLDDRETLRLRRCCEALLIMLSEIFLIPLGTEDTGPWERSFRQEQPLKERLQGIRENPVCQLFNVPLMDYYRAVSSIAQCPYPDWIYRKKIQPLLKESKKTEKEWTVRFLTAYCSVCREENGPHDWAESMPILYDLLTVPACIQQV